MDRRQSLGLMGTFAATLASASAAHATTARAVTLVDLVARSTRIARATALDSFARAEDIGGTRHIVTYSRMRIDEQIHARAAIRKPWCAHSVGAPPTWAKSSMARPNWY